MNWEVILYIALMSALITAAYRYGHFVGSTRALLKIEAILNEADETKKEDDAG